MIRVKAPDLDRFFVDTDIMVDAMEHVRKTRSCDMSRVRYEYVPVHVAQRLRKMNGMRIEQPAQMRALKEDSA